MRVVGFKKFEQLLLGFQYHVSTDDACSSVFETDFKYQPVPYIPDPQKIYTAPHKFVREREQAQAQSEQALQLARHPALNRGRSATLADANCGAGAWSQELLVRQHV
jgi:hypothetical protein